MDVWFCESQEPPPGGTTRALKILQYASYALLRARQESRFFS
jgi:hypothetical protein